MCVIAGYIGNRSAASVLIEMMRREEGLDAGFYTGIATLHHGKLHYRKVVGDLVTLLDETDASELPGTIGMIHSRTPSGGNVEWGHPFVDAEEKLAYIANGGQGRFQRIGNIESVGNGLLDQGVFFKSSSKEKISAKSPVLKNGDCIHGSDLMCQLIAQNYLEKPSTAQGLMAALREAFVTMMTEIVGVAIHVDYPDHLFIARHNQPMQIAISKGGETYVASTRLAFPTDISWRTQFRVPVFSGALCHRSEGVQILPFQNMPEGVALQERPSFQALTKQVEEWMQAEETATKPEIAKRIMPLWKSNLFTEANAMAYEIMESLYAEGRITLETKRIPGMEGVGTVPRTYARLK